MNGRSYPALILLINYVPALYLSAAVAVPLLYGFDTGAAVSFLFAYVYLFPPLLCRALLALFGRPTGSVTSDSPVFMYWWFLTQLQIPFVRFPFLEELLRSFPGVYNLWLNLWGGRVSLFAYWSPAVTLTDRYLMRIGRGVVLGGGCRIGAHIVENSADGGQRLTLAPVTLEEHCVIGIHAAIGPGCRVHARETVPAGKILKPFYEWKDARARRPQAQP